MKQIHCISKYLTSAITKYYSYYNLSNVINSKETIFPRVNFPRVMNPIPFASRFSVFSNKSYLSCNRYFNENLVFI